MTWKILKEKVRTFIYQRGDSEACDLSYDNKLIKKFLMSLIY